MIVIAGPCVLDSYGEALVIARHCAGACKKLGVDYYFKASWDKANRSSGFSYRGVGLSDGLDWLGRIKEEVGCRVLTDFHEPGQAWAVAEVADVLQVPALLCRQTDMILAAAKTGKIVNIKKGQFMSGSAMYHAVSKADGAPVWVTERGSMYGYGDLVVDYRGLVDMRGFGCPIIFDATHSAQKPAAGAVNSGGDRRYSLPLARAAVAVGVDGLFFEVHPDPDKAKCDGPNSLKMEDFEPILAGCMDIYNGYR